MLGALVALCSMCLAVASSQARHDYGHVHHQPLAAHEIAPTVVTCTHARSPGICSRSAWASWSPVEARAQQQAPQQRQLPRLSLEQPGRERQVQVLERRRPRRRLHQRAAGCRQLARQRRAVTEQGQQRHRHHRVALLRHPVARRRREGSLANSAAGRQG